MHLNYTVQYLKIKKNNTDIFASENISFEFDFTLKEISKVLWQLF